MTPPKDASAPPARATGQAPHQPADLAAVAQARAMLRDARHAVLAVLDADGWPMTSRIGLQTDPQGVPLALLSGLALHSAALRADPRAALLVDPLTPGRGSPLAQPRLSVQVQALPVDDPVAAQALRADWRRRDPKAAVYLDLPDFRFWRLLPQGGLLNAGFGRAILLGPDDLCAPDA